VSGPVQRIIESNGIRLNIAEQGNGPPVILCHGFPESWYSWRHQLTALAAAGFHAIAPDMRGYGKSDRPEAIDQYTIFHLTGDLVGLLDAIEAPTAVIVGHDWGAQIAWQAARPAPRPLPRRCKPQRTASAAWSGAPDQHDAADRGRTVLSVVFSAARRGRGRDGAGSAGHGA
jgi:pimeloyl-ACP methyl ester carboxylesterase